MTVRVSKTAEKFGFSVTFPSSITTSESSFSGWTFIGHPGLIWRDGLAYAFASFYVLTIPITGTFFSSLMSSDPLSVFLLPPHNISLLPFFFSSQSLRYFFIFSSYTHPVLSSLASSLPLYYSILFFPSTLPLT